MILKDVKLPTKYLTYNIYSLPENTGTCYSIEVNKSFSFKHFFDQNKELYLLTKHLSPVASRIFDRYVSNCTVTQNITTQIDDTPEFDISQLDLLESEFFSIGLHFTYTNKRMYSDESQIFYYNVAYKIKPVLENI